MVSVNYDMHDEFVQVLGNTNTVIAAYTTAQARLKLYSYIEKLQDRTLYFDTDSIVYLDRENDSYHPSTGNFLGMESKNIYLSSYEVFKQTRLNSLISGCMTDELEKDYGQGSFITEFVSGGPKYACLKLDMVQIHIMLFRHYAYKVWSEKDQAEKTIIKVKGFKLTYNATADINFDKMREIVHAFVQNRDRKETLLRIQRIERTQERKVVTVIRKKVYRVTYTKRVIQSDFTTVPYGYCIPCIG